MSKFTSICARDTTHHPCPFQMSDLVGHALLLCLQEMRVDVLHLVHVGWQEREGAPEHNEWSHGPRYISGIEYSRSHALFDDILSFSRFIMRVAITLVTKEFTTEAHIAILLKYDLREPDNAELRPEYDCFTGTRLLQLRWHVEGFIRYEQDKHLAKRYYEFACALSDSCFYSTEGKSYENRDADYEVF